MKKMLLTLILILFGISGAHADCLSSTPDTVVKKSVIVRKDTVEIFDTIVSRRVIHRYDTVHRTEISVGAVTFIHKLDSIKKSLEVPEDGMTDTVASPALIKDSIPQRSGQSCTAGKDGTFIWIPDSMKVKVGALLSGEPKQTDEAVSGKYAMFRGDTVPLILRSRNLGRYDRGLFNHLYIPKGIWQFGATVSYGEFSTKDLEVFDLLSDIDFSGHIFSIRPYMQYFIDNNMSVGMRLQYTSGQANIDSFKVDIDDDINFNLNDIMYKSESYSASLLFTQYLGMSPHSRFGIFNEVELAFSSGNSDFIRPYGGEAKHTHSTSMGVALNFSPGISVFLMEPVSFNLSFGVFGYSLRSEKQSVDGVDMGRRLTSGANFKFNIFNINLGIAVNI